MKLIPVLTLYMQDIYKGGLAAEPVLYCIYNMPNFIKNVQFLREIFICIVYTVHLSFSSAQINPAASNSAFRWPYRSSDPTGIWTRKSPDRQSGGITNYPMRPLHMPACALSIYPQIYTRILFATKRKPNGQGEIRTHNVSSVTVLQTACFSHFAYLP